MQQEILTSITAFGLNLARLSVNCTERESVESAGFEISAPSAQARDASGDSLGVDRVECRKYFISWHLDYRGTSFTACAIYGAR
jgi:hypothetical protein